MHHDSGKSKPVTPGPLNLIFYKLIHHSYFSQYTDSFHTNMLDIIFHRSQSIRFKFCMLADLPPSYQTAVSGLPHVPIHSEYFFTPIYVSEYKLSQNDRLHHAFLINLQKEKKKQYYGFRVVSILWDPPPLQESEPTHTFGLVTAHSYIIVSLCQSTRVMSHQQLSFWHVPAR